MKQPSLSGTPAKLPHIAYGVKDKTCPVCSRLRDKKSPVCLKALKKGKCPRCGAALLKPQKKAMTSRRPETPVEEAEVSRRGRCPCGILFRQHESCYGCGILIGARHMEKIPHRFKDRTLCSSCNRKILKVGYLNLDDHRRYTAKGAIVPYRPGLSMIMNEEDRKLWNWIQMNLSGRRNRRAAA